MLFSGGAIGLGLFLWGLWMAFRRATRRQDHGAVSLLLFFVVYGITEPTIGGLVAYVPIAFYGAAILAMLPPDRPLRGHPAISPRRLTVVPSPGPS